MLLALIVGLLALASLAPPPEGRRPPGNAMEPAPTAGDPLDRGVDVLGSDEQAVSTAGPSTSPDTTAERPRTYIAAPDGSPDAEGTRAEPLDLQKALGASSPVGPGDKLLLRGGTYDGAFTSYLMGTEAARIVVQSYKKEWAVIDGGTMRAATLNVQGHDVTYRGFEVMKSDPNRVSGEPTNNPSDNSRARWSGVWVQAPRTKLINLVVHDNGDGIGMWRPSVDSEIYGCVIYNNGWIGADRPWGHAIYLQNESGTQTIRNNVMFNNYAYGFHAYDMWGPIRNLVIEDNVSFENGSAGGARQANFFAGTVYGPIDDVALRNNVAYHRAGANGYNVRLGYPDQPSVTGEHGGVTVAGNRIVGGSRSLALAGWRTADVAGNYLVARPGSEGSSSIVSEIIPHTDLLGTELTDYRWNDNSYVDLNGGSVPRSFGYGSGATFERRSFPEWKESMGFDDVSTYDAESPDGRRVIIKKNRYERGRAHITVLNWNGDDRLVLDLSRTGLRKGQRFVIRDVQDMSGSPLLQGTYRGRRVSVPLDRDSVTPPVGTLPVNVSHTPGDFASLLVAPR